MSQPVKSLLGDLQGVVRQLGDQNNKKEVGPVKREPPAQEPGMAPASTLNNADEKKIREVNDLNIKVAGVVIGVDIDNDDTTKLERVEVTPEPDGRVRIILSVKKEEL
jgi:hypothetical protein